MDGDATLGAGTGGRTGGRVRRVRQRLHRAVGDAVMLGRFTRDVPRFLRTPITLEAARDTLRRDLASREQRFLAIADRAIYSRPTSPYARLLRNAGCQVGDLRALVAREGIEGALRTLADAGVHVTFDEFKGRREAIRGSQRFTFSQREFDN